MEMANIADNASKPLPTQKQEATKSKKIPMLTSSQLSDLFGRLDSNGDGKLDMSEFLGVIQKLKLGKEIPEDDIASIFKAVDLDAKGTLNMQEFICAYQKIYCRTLNKKTSMRNLTAEEKGAGEYLRATRYGYDANGQYIFECYCISSDASGGKIVFNDLPQRGLGADASKLERSYDEYEKAATIDNTWTGTREQINAMILADGINNETAGSQLLWWVDVAMSHVSRTNIQKYVASFGLPNDAKFLSSFGNFGAAFSKERSARFFVGNGVTEKGGVSSFNAFIQTTYVKNRPIHHLLPSWLELDFFYENFIGSAIAEYYSQRFAWLFNLSSYSGTRLEEKFASYMGAETLADRLRDEDNTEYNEKSKNSFRRGMPPPPSPFSHKSAPSWVLSSSEMKRSPPMLGFKTLGVHLLNQGYGTNCLITFREIDDEKNRSAINLDQKTSLGQLGRIMSGIWRKLFEVTCKAGTASVGGELDDSSGALAVFMILMTHSLSMNTMGSIESWMRTIENEVSEMTVSKHDDHLMAIQSLVENFNEYVAPYHDTFSEFIEEMDNAEESEAAKEVDEIKLQNKGNGRSSSVLADGASGHAISFENAKCFWGDNHKFIRREFSYLLDGNEALEVKGLKYWKSRLAEFNVDLADIKGEMSSRISEKRDFTSFTFTIVTVLLAPLTILTGYWGMNFDNMIELDSTTYPTVPGVKLLWVTIGVIYSLILLACFHYRIIYSAT